MSRAYAKDYAKILSERDRTKNYRASPFFGGQMFLLGQSREESFRVGQVMRIGRFKQWSGCLHTSNYEALDLDLLQGKIDKHSPSDLSSVVIYDPTPKNKRGTPFVSVARTELEVDDAIDFVNGYSEKPTFCRDFQRSPGIVGKRAYNPATINMGELQRERTLFLALEKLYSNRGRGKIPIDPEILQIMINEYVFLNPQ
ncbi:MAG: hypothetical protein ABIH37_00905 [archaeon]